MGGGSMGIVEAFYRMIGCEVRTEAREQQHATAVLAERIRRAGDRAQKADAAMVTGIEGDAADILDRVKVRKRHEANGHG